MILFSLVSMLGMFLNSAIAGALSTECMAFGGFRGSIIFVFALLFFGGFITSTLSGVFFYLGIRE
jgi:hypothetical protein